MKKGNIQINQNQIADLVPKNGKKSFDWEFGGMASSSKFMMPNNYHFLDALRTPKERFTNY